MSSNPIGEPNIHPSCVVYSGMQIGEGVRIGANSTIGAYPTSFTSVKEGGKKIFLREEARGMVVIEDGADIGANVVVVRGVERDTLIKKNVVIGNLCNIGHDNVVGERSSISLGALMAGFVEIGNDTIVGMHSEIRERVIVGDHVYIGMGSQVLRDVPDYSFGYGRPFKILGRTDDIKIKARLLTRNIRRKFRKGLK